MVNTEYMKYPAMLRYINIEFVLSRELCFYLREILIFIFSAHRLRQHSNFQDLFERLSESQSSETKKSPTNRHLAYN